MRAALAGRRGDRQRGRGLSAQLLAQCDGQIIIPMQPGAESLNAAVAAAVVMWEIARTGM